MAKTPKQQYQDDNYDRVAIRVKKGLRDVYKRIAADLNLSLSQLIQRSVESYATNGGEVNLPAQPAPITTQPAEQISANQRRLLDVVEKLPADAQKSLLKFLQSLNAQQVNTVAAAENAAKNASVDAHEPI